MEVYRGTVHQYLSPPLHSQTLTDAETETETEIVPTSKGKVTQKKKSSCEAFFPALFFVHVTVAGTVQQQTLHIST